VTEIAVKIEPKRLRRTRRQAAAERRYPARVARQLALAHALQRRVDDGEFPDYATMARALGFTRARISQIMDLLLLAPDIQTEILFLECIPGRQPVSERALRKVVASRMWAEQMTAWRSLKPVSPGSA